jgi:hypothetical protein
MCKAEGPVMAQTMTMNNRWKSSTMLLKITFS